MRFESGIIILECGDFREVLPHDYSCCKTCHERAILANVNLSRETGLFVVRPPAAPHLVQEWMADFTLHLTSHVCCAILCRVTSLPHSWWKEKSHELKAEEVWNEARFGHKKGVKGYEEESPTQSAPRKRRVTQPDEEPDFRAWLRR